MSNGVEVGDGTAISPAVLSEIESLHLTARHTAMGALAGMHRSTGRGTSIEFSEHKVYSPGDDIRHIDWHAYAKTDRFHIKQFEDETNLRLELLVDHSASMGFVGSAETAAKSSGEVSPKKTTGDKLTLCRTLAAAFAYLALRQGDTTGLTTFHAAAADRLPSDTDTSGIDVLPGRANSTHLVEILRRLVALKPTGATDLVGALGYFAQARRRRSVVILLSDLFDPSPQLIPQLRQLAAQRHDVIVLQTLDEAELDFPFDNPAVFASMEDDRKLFVHPRALRQAFVEEMLAYTSRLAKELSESGVHYRLLRTSDDAAKILGSILRERQGQR